MQRNTVQSYPLTIAQQSVSQQPACNAVQFFNLCAEKCCYNALNYTTLHRADKNVGGPPAYKSEKKVLLDEIGGEGEDKEFRSSADFLEKIARKTNMTLQ